MQISTSDDYMSIPVNSRVKILLSGPILKVPTIHLTLISSHENDLQLKEKHRNLTILTHKIIINISNKGCFNKSIKKIIARSIKPISSKAKRP